MNDKDQMIEKALAAIVAASADGSSLLFKAGYCLTTETTWGYCPGCGFGGYGLALYDSAGELVARYKHPGPHWCDDGALEY